MKTEMIANDEYGTVFSDSVASLELWVKNLTKASWDKVANTKRLGKKRQKVRAEFMVKVNTVIGWWIRIAISNRVMISPERVRALEFIDLAIQRVIQEVVYGPNGGSIFSRDVFADIGSDILESDGKILNALFDSDRMYRNIPYIMENVGKKIQTIVAMFESFVRTSETWQAQEQLFGTRAERKAFLDRVERESAEGNETHEVQ